MNNDQLAALRSRIASEPAGPELDALVARALGCQPVLRETGIGYKCHCDECQHCSPGEMFTLKRYSTDLRWVGEMLVGLRKYCEYDFRTGCAYNTFSVESNGFFMEEAIELVVARELAAAWAQTQEVAK